MKRLHKILLGVVAAAGFGLAAADPGPGGGGYGPGMMGHGGPGMRGGRFGGDPAAAIDSRLTALKGELKITSAQEPAWKAYADAAKQQGETMAKMHAQAQAAPQSAPDRMALRADIMKQQAAGMERTSSAFKQLYAALTPEQKAVADREVGGFHGPRFGRGR